MLRFSTLALCATSCCVGRATAARIKHGQETCTAKNVFTASGEEASGDVGTLDTAAFMRHLASGVDPSAIMACYNIHTAEAEAGMSWAQWTKNQVIGGLARGFTARATGVGRKLRAAIAWPARSVMSLVNGRDRVDLMRWAFEHHDGANSFCKDPERAAGAARDLGELLVAGGAETAGGADPAAHRVVVRLGELIKKVVGATLVADCGLPTDTSREEIKLVWDRKRAWSRTVKKTLQQLDVAPKTPRELEYVLELVDIFQEYTAAKDLDLDSPEMPPEFAGLWKMMREVPDERDARVFKRPSAKESTAPSDCSCNAVADATAKALAERLREVGVDVDAARDDWVWKQTNTSRMLDFLTLTEAGLKDPVISFRGMLGEANRMPALPTNAEGVSEESKARSKVKAVLVGLPMFQNFLAHLDWTHGLRSGITKNYPAKLKWFLFLNIAWAVWHEVEQVSMGVPTMVSQRHREENVAIGLLVSAMSLLSTFSWDGVLFRETNTAAFNDWNVALYTIWNYRWVRALFGPRRLQFHLWAGLGLPMAETLGNHEGDSAYWVNYRRDGLMTALMNLSPQPGDDDQPAWNSEASAAAQDDDGLVGTLNLMSAQADVDHCSCAI